MAAVAPDTVRALYLGYPLEITDRTITVTTPDGRRIARTQSLSTARRIIRGYRKTTEPTASLAKATAGSNHIGG